jgi:hypothetical protein
MIAHDPLLRSGRAELPHPAPTLGKDAHALARIRMTNLSRWKPPRNETLHAAPWQMVTLTATAQYPPPQVAYCLAKSAQRMAIHGYSVIPEVTQQDRAQVCSLFPNGRVHASPQFFFQSPQLGLPPLAHRLAQHREVSLPSFPATVWESRPGESHPEPLAEPDMNLSAHPAPIKQTLRSFRYPSVRREPFVPRQAVVETGSPGPYGL